MSAGIIKKFIREKAGGENSNVFTESKTDILLEKDRVASIYLGPLIRNHPDRYAREDQKENLSDGKREIRIEAASYYSPITGSWLRRGFELFDKLKEESVEVEWERDLKRIKRSPKNKSIVSLIDDFKKAEGKQLYYYYSGLTPTFWIRGDIKPVERFIDAYKEAINLDEAILKDHNPRKDFCLSIGKNLLNFGMTCTNKDSIKYAGLVDEFLK